MDPTIRTGLFIIAAILIISGYDIWTKVKYGTDSTISRCLRRWNEYWPLLGYLVAFAMGAGVGHFFCQTVID